MKSQEILKLRGCNLQQLTDAFFNTSDMKKVNSDHHKNRDGNLEVAYCWYFDNEYQGANAWSVYHPGYVRGEIEGKGRTLQTALDNFIQNWADELER